MPEHTMLFCDGENLVFRYQECIDKKGLKPKEEVIHIRDVFIWHPALTTWSAEYFRRANYYTTVVGDADRVSEIEQQIAEVTYECRSYSGERYSAQLVPHVFKKPKQSQKTRMVDISICTDLLRHSHQEGTNRMVLAAGDGDYLPLLHEAMRLGKQVSVMAFSDGLCPELVYSVDEFKSLDDIFFEPRT